MGAIQEKFDGARAGFERLTQREQSLVAGAAVTAVLMVLLLVGLSVSSAIQKGERRIKYKTEALAEVMQLQGEYKAKQGLQKQLMRQLGRSKVRLVKVVEDAARSAGIDKDLGRLQPSAEGEPNEAGVVESLVELSARNLSIDRLQKFLSNLAAAPGVVIVSKLRVTRPYRKETIDIEMTVLTYKAKST